MEPTDSADPSEAELWPRLESFRNRLRRVVELRIDPRLKGRVDPSDVIQDTFLEVSRRLPQYQANPEVSLYLWVRYLTVQRILQLRRAHVDVAARDVRREIKLGNALGPAASSMTLARSFAASGLSPSQAVSQEEEIDRLTEALEGLKEIDREVLALRHFEQLDNSEVAQILGLTESGASYRYVRALRRLRGVLET